MITKTAITPAFSSVTEHPWQGATCVQMSMLRTRYGWAAEHAFGKDVLEVACGAGLGLGWLAKHARCVEAGDIDPENCRIAQGTYRGQSNVHVQRMDALELPFEAGSFDLALLFEALYYLADVPQFLAEARRVLRPRGELLISMVNCEGSGFHPSPLHTKYWSATEFLEIIEAAGFEVRVFAGFPESDRLRTWLKGVAACWGWIPSTMRGKAVLKRLVYGRLDYIPARLEPGEPVEHMIALDGRTDFTRYRNLYFECRRAV